MKLEVLSTQWAADGDVYEGGVHEIEKPSAKLLRLIGHAEAAGVVKAQASQDERSKMKVEPDSESAKKVLKAQESGVWHEGNLADRLSTWNVLLSDEDLKLDASIRHRIEFQVKQAQRIQDRMSKGQNYEEAAAGG